MNTTNDDAQATSETAAFYPIEWGEPVLYPFAKHDGSPKRRPVKAILEDMGLIYEVCADCLQGAMIWYGDLALHLQRSSRYVQLSPHLKIRVTAKGIRVRQATPLTIPPCRYTTD